MKHCEIKVGETYYYLGDKDYRLIALSVGDEVVNMGWNTYAKTVRFRREFYSKGMDSQVVTISFGETPINNDWSEVEFTNDRIREL